MTSKVTPEGINRKSAVETVIETWGQGNPYWVPEWIMTLAKECDAGSRQQVAEKYQTAVPRLSEVFGSLGTLSARVHAEMAKREPREAHTTQSRDTAIAKWGDGNADAVPAWVMALATAADSMPRKQLARQLDFSESVISQVLNKTYRASAVHLEGAVRGLLMHESVMCPHLGDLRTNVCVTYQRWPPQREANRLLARVIRSCPSCPNYRGSKQ